jgi:probable rRNA maturation factor
MSSGPGRLRTSVQFATRPPGVPAPGTLRRYAQCAYSAIRRRPAALTLRVVGEAEGRRLNRRWRSRDQATNVLSFAQPRLPGLRPDMLGDIVLCAPVIAREARQRGIAARAHWAHLVTHGVLHLLGHVHERARDARRMQALERRVLAGLRFADPYA